MVGNRTGRGTVRALVALGAVLMTLPGCGSARMKSAWRADPLHADAAVASWSGVEYHNDGGVRMGLLNDGEHLYVRILAKDPQTERMWLHGFTLWVGGTDPADRRIGVRVVPDGDPEDLPPPGSGEPERETVVKRAERLRSAVTHVDVLSPAGDVEERRSVPADAGIDFRTEAADAVACVIRIPVAFLPDRAGPMGIAVISEEVDPQGFADARGGPPGGGRPGGNAPGGGAPGGGAPGGGRSGIRGNRPAPPEPLDIWTTFVLAVPE